MKQIIMDVLDDMSNSQVNLGSSAARKMVSTLISTALESKGCYTEYDDSEIEEQNARATWVCSICGENTADVDYDYLGSGTNHLGCELKSQKEIDEYIEDIDEQAYAQGRGSSKTVQTLDDGGGITYREKNWLQKKHENKVFGGDTGTDADFNIPAGEEVDGMYFDDEVKEWEEAVGYVEKDDSESTVGHDMGGSYESTDTMTGHDHGKVWPGSDAIQKQIYNEMTSDGLPEGGDAQAVLESHKLAEEIVEAQEGTWIYESPDGGKTVFRRPFSDYDPKNKEEIDWKTKEPTGRKFTDYNNGNWGSKDNE